MKRCTKTVCEICGIPWKEGKGFIGKHIQPCANARYGWKFVKEIDDRPTPGKKEKHE